MRNSDIITDNFNSEPEVVKINDLPECNQFEYDLMEEKDFKKYMKDVERMVRNSMEYRLMVKFLRENMDMNKCSFYENVNNIDTFKIKIHLHHHPFTLYDICYIVYKKRCAYGEPVDVEDVAKEVMHIHYNMMVGLIPLAETPHELVHNKYLFVPLDRVYGAWSAFYDMYFPFMDLDYIENIRENVERTKAYKESEEELGVLAKKYVYVDVDSGIYDIPDYTTVIQAMEKRIATINEEERLNHQPMRKVIHFIKANGEKETNNSIF